ncbi:MAG: hypothetical protein WC828_02810 [Thermoleophilia bacterium]|jgi:Tol biopolymer transport system component
MNRVRSLYFLAFIFSVLLLSAVVPGCGDDSNQTTEKAGNGEAPVPPRKTDVIVFIRGTEVWAVNPNNGAERQVTSDGATKVWPRISPDGKQVVYQVLQGDGSSSGGIFRVPLAQNGGQPEQIHATGAFPAWSTDGKSIAFVKKSQAANSQYADDIALINTANPGTGEQVLTDHSQVVDMGGALSVQNLEYSPDGGKYIYFMRGRRSDSRWLARVEVATKKEDDVTTPPGAMPQSLAEGGFSLFNVSQMEGRRALISRGDLTGGNYQQNPKLYIRFLDPELEDSMIEEAAGSINPSLKPDNTRFVYENQGALYKHNLAGGPGIEKITEGGMPDWGASADGPGFGDDDTGTTKTSTTTTTTTTSGDTGGGLTGDCGAGDIPGTEYIKNGGFENGTAGWQIVDIKKQGSNNTELTADAVCGKILILTRSNSKNDGGLVGVEQPVDVQLAGLSTLRLRLVGAIDSQALASDGWYGGETPVFVTIDYTTATGQSKTWTHGLMSAGSGVNYPDRDQVIPAGAGWYQYDIPDLLKVIPDAARLTKVTVGGSGWDFKSRVGLVSLKGS